MIYNIQNETRFQKEINLLYEKIDIKKELNVDIYLIAKRLGFVIEEFKKLPDNVMGVMFLDMDNKFKKLVKSDKLIGLNYNFSEKYKRFTIAHEIGHYILHYDRCKNGDNIVYCQHKDDEKGIEGEANLFAAMLLIDKELFQEEYFNISNKTIDFKIGYLSDIFNVPMPAIRRRIKEVIQ